MAPMAVSALLNNASRLKSVFSSLCFYPQILIDQAIRQGTLESVNLKNVLVNEEFVNRLDSKQLFSSFQLEYFGIKYSNKRALR
ncbi:hypothetical protein L596_005145 [Steinernema carpocapsae]|uniref:Uncharacterized protein n=1 Tax=Steinernema carpocapsae TaxID=34508 RepID=A0A4U8UZJ8_STECR|nr:hypothetical protein L596_005145 [Steinernema carpocapsae]